MDKVEHSPSDFGVKLSLDLEDLKPKYDTIFPKIFDALDHVVEPHVKGQFECLLSDVYDTFLKPELDATSRKFLNVIQAFLQNPTPINKKQALQAIQQRRWNIKAVSKLRHAKALQSQVRSLIDYFKHHLPKQEEADTSTCRGTSAKREISKPKTCQKTRETNVKENTISLEIEDRKTELLVGESSRSKAGHEDLVEEEIKSNVPDIAPLVTREKTSEEPKETSPVYEPNNTIVQTTGRQDTNDKNGLRKLKKASKIVDKTSSSNPPRKSSPKTSNKTVSDAAPEKCSTDELEAPIGNEICTNVDEGRCIDDGNNNKADAGDTVNNNIEVSHGESQVNVEENKDNNARQLDSYEIADSTIKREDENDDTENKLTILTTNAPDQVLLDTADGLVEPNKTAIDVSLPMEPIINTTENCTVEGSESNQCDNTGNHTASNTSRLGKSKPITTTDCQNDQRVPEKNQENQTKKEQLDMLITDFPHVEMNIPTNGDSLSEVRDDATPTKSTELINSERIEQLIYQTKEYRPSTIDIKTDEATNDILKWEREQDKTVNCLGRAKTSKDAERVSSVGDNTPVVNHNLSTKPPKVSKTTNPATKSIKNEPSDLIVACPIPNVDSTPEANDRLAADSTRTPSNKQQLVSNSSHTEYVIGRHVVETLTSSGNDAGAMLIRNDVPKFDSLVEKVKCLGLSIQDRKTKVDLMNKCNDILSQQVSEVENTLESFDSYLQTVQLKPSPTPHDTLKREMYNFQEALIQRIFASIEVLSTHMKQLRTTERTKASRVKALLDKYDVTKSETPEALVNFGCASRTSCPTSLTSFANVSSYEQLSQGLHALIKGIELFHASCEDTWDETMSKIFFELEALFASLPSPPLHRWSPDDPRSSSCLSLSHSDSMELDLQNIKELPEDKSKYGSVIVFSLRMLERVSTELGHLMVLIRIKDLQILSVDHSIGLAYMSMKQMMLPRFLTTLHAPGKRAKRKKSLKGAIPNESLKHATETSTESEQQKLKPADLVQHEKDLAERLSRNTNIDTRQLKRRPWDGRDDSNAEVKSANKAVLANQMESGNAHHMGSVVDMRQPLIGLQADTELMSAKLVSSSLTNGISPWTNIIKERADTSPDYTKQSLNKRRENSSPSPRVFSRLPKIQNIQNNNKAKRITPPQTPTFRSKKRGIKCPVMFENEAGQPVDSMGYPIGGKRGGTYRQYCRVIAMPRSRSKSAKCNRR